MGNKMDNKTHVIISILFGLLWIFMAFWRYEEGGGAAISVFFIVVGLLFFVNGIRHFLRDRK